MSGRSDAELVEAVLSGDRASYGPLVRRHQERLYRRALAILHDPDAAADAVQESFIRAYDRLADCSDPDRFGPWIYRMVRNLCLDELRSPRQRAEPLSRSLASERAGPAKDLRRTEIGAAVRGALDELTPPLREAFVLKHVEGLSYDEIEGSTGVGRSALKMRVKRAREELERLLRPILDDPGDVTPPAPDPSSGVERTARRPQGKRQ